jgi:hypothetical protein
MEKPVSPAIKKRAEEFSDKFLSLEKGLKGFHGKEMGEGRGSFFLCLSLGFKSGLGFSEFLVLLQVLRQGHWGGNLNPNQDVSFYMTV